MYALNHYWAWDASYRRKQSIKLMKFILSAVLTGMFSIASIVFWGLEMQVRKSNYDACLLAARNSLRKEEELDNYQKAIRLNPFRKEAYLALLRDGFLDDNVLTTKESEKLRSILIAYADEERTNERVFQENEIGYDEFSYEAGIAYYYKFEEKSNKKNAKGYFKTAQESPYLSEQQVERARRLYTISDYYAKVGIVDEAGDAFVTYSDYWEDLTGLLEGNLVELDNERTALVMYEELISQLISHTVEFRDAGVKEEEILSELRQIRQHIEQDFRDVTDGGMEQDMQRLEMNIDTARKIVQSVYGQEELME